MRHGTRRERRKARDVNAREAADEDEPGICDRCGDPIAPHDETVTCGQRYAHAACSRAAHEAGDLEWAERLRCRVCGQVALEWSGAVWVCGRCEEGT